MSELGSRIRAHALANALKYNGQANPKNVLPKILGEFPEEKKNVPALLERITSVVDEVNRFDLDRQRSDLEQLAPELLEKKVQKEKDLPELPNATKGNVVTRIPPEPSKYNHLGHALTFLINSTYAQRYEGACVLRFEDANPEKVTQEYVDAMLEDIQEYLGITPSTIVYVSDHMEQLLEYAEQLVRSGDAYMCFCPREEMAENRKSGIECACRASPVEKNLDEWRNFVSGAYMDGQCVLRFKGDMQSKNSVMLDPVLWRAVKEPHFRKGSRYHIWPLYDFYSPIEEHLCDVTHVIRSNEFDLRVELQQKMQRALGLAEPETIHYGRFNIRDATTKGREIREGIEQGLYTGWDDPRLVTLKALRRRGIRRDAYMLLVKQLGLSPYPVTLDFTMLAALNRQIVDPIANRYSFIPDPMEISIEGAPHEEVTLHLHPDKKSGGRVLRTTGTYYVRKDDVAKFGDGQVRLKDHLTFHKEGLQFVSDGHDLPKKKGSPTINWVPAGAEHVPVEVMMPDATIVRGVAEITIKNVQVDEVIQFERFGFCRLDRIDDGLYVFWYTHD